MKTTLIERVHSWYAATQSALSNQTVLVGVSGGADSLCLLHMLVALRERLGLTLHVAHLNHQLRGAASDADAAFVAATARAWGVPLTTAARDVQAFADAQRLNLHAAARTVRYDWLAQQADLVGAGAVAVAHTADDQAETVLMHLLRGAGPAGLRGMPTATDLRRLRGAGTARDAMPGCTLLRPLLTTTRAEIEQHCHDHGLQPREDASNRDSQFTRNRIRHELLPQLATFNPQIVASLGRSAASIADLHTFGQQALDAAWPALVQQQSDMLAFNGAHWRGLHPALQREALRRAYQLLDGGDTLTAERLEQAQQVIGRSRRRIELPGGLWLTTEAGGNFALRRGAPRHAAMAGPQLVGDETPLPIPGVVALAGGWSLLAEIMPAPQHPAHSAWQVQLDAAALHGPLVLRRRRAGDRMRPAGGRGSRALQDMFVDARIAQPLRAAWPVLATGDAVVWVPGLRANAAFIATAQTRELVRIQLREPRVDSYEVTRSIIMHSDIDHVLLSEETIRAKVQELGAQISASYAAHDELLLVGVLKGCVMFIVDLARAIDLPIAIDFIAISSYGGSRESSGVVRLLKDLDTDIADRHVLIVEDIIDSGLTVEYLRSQLLRRNPASLRVCSLLNKPERRANAMAIDFLGFDIPNEFVVGYGLDYAERYRNLPYIGVLKEAVYSE